MFIKNYNRSRSNLEGNCIYSTLVIKLLIDKEIKV